MTRLLDILFSLMALIVLLPLFIPICIILLFTGEREVFYLQERIGRYGKPFYAYKFTTILKGSETMGSGTLTVKNNLNANKNLVISTTILQLLTKIELTELI